MGMSPDQVAQAADYFGAKNAARATAVQQLGAAPMFTGVAAAAKASGSKGASVAASIGNQPVPSNITPAQDPNGPGSILDTINQIPVLGAFTNTWAPDFSGKTIGQEMFQAQGKSQAPQNVTQGLLNFLSGGAYASGRFFHDIGQNVSDMNAKISADPSYTGSPQYYADLAHGAVSPLGGAARGLAEGFGARFDNQAPILPGNDLKDVGVSGAANTAVKGAVGGLTGNNALASVAGNVAGGVVEGAGNVALDPTTYIGGTGLVKGLLHGAAQGGAVARGGGDLLDILGAAGKGTIAGAAASRTEAVATKAEIAAGKASDKAGLTPTNTLAGQQAVDAARLAQGVPEGLPVHPDVAAQMPNDIAALVKPENVPVPGAKIPNEAALPKVDAALGAPATGKILGDAALPQHAAPNLAGETGAKLLGDPRAQTVQDLLPSLRRTGLDAQKVMTDAATPHVHPLAITPETAAAVRNVIATGEVKDIAPAIAAIKTTPDGATFLSRPVKVGGQQTTIEKVLNDAATNHAIARFTDGTPSAKGLLNAKAIDQAVTMAQTAAKPQYLERTQQSLMGAVKAQGFGDIPQMSDLVSRALYLPAAQRKDALMQAFGQGTGFSNFDQAMKAAADGQVESSMMRSMLKALGVDSKATTTTGLQKALNARGAMNWDAIKNTVPTTQEVLDSHGVSSTTMEAAKTVDTTQAAADAAATYEKNVVETAGTDPTVLEPLNTSTVHVLVGTMINRGVAAVMDLSKRANGVFSELYNNEAWLAVHRALMGVIRHAANGQALEGQARQDFIYARYGEAIREVETHQRSLSQYPQLQYGAGEQPLYVSFGQIYHGLPKDVIAPALFNLNHELGKGLNNPIFKEGLAVYPTTIGNGVRAAINGADAAAIRDALRGSSKGGGLNTFEYSPAGQHALDNLALAISDPAFVNRMKQLHDSQQILAVAKANLDAAATVSPLRDAVIAAATKVGGDRADMTAAIKAAAKGASDLAPAGAESFTRDIASQEVHNGVINSVQDVGVASLRADDRAVKAAHGDATQAEIKAKASAANAKYKAAKTKTGQQIPPTIPTTTTPADKLLRNATAEGNVAWSEDMAPSIQARAEQMIHEDHIYEDTMKGNIDAMTNAEIQSGFARLFARIGQMFNGIYGHAQIADIRVDATTAAQQLAQRYRSQLRGYFWGTSIRPAGFFGKSQRSEGIAGPLGQELGLGRNANKQEMNQATVDMWAAIAGHEAAAGHQLSDGELAAALQQGRTGIGNAGVGGIEPMSPGMTQLALDYNELRSQVFHPDGLLQRAGITSKDLMREMDRFGMGKTGPLAKHMPPTNVATADLGTLDHVFDFSTMTNPLDVLNATMHAVSAASIRPAIGAALSHMIDHQAIAASKTIQELKALHWSTIDTTGEGGIAPYLNPKSMFPPEIITQMKYMNSFMNEMEKPLPPVLANIFRLSDPVTNLWKQGVTSINPRHHVSNILGDFGMNALAGVNPMYGAKATLALHELGKIGQGDTGPLHAAIDGIADPNTTVKASWHSTSVTITIGSEANGFTKVALTPQQYWKLGMDRGAFQGAHDAMDVVDQMTKKTGLGNKPNIIGEGNRGLGDFSATRDNLPRLAHFMHVLESRPFNSVEDAVRMATKDVHKWHPTIAAMSPFEQKYVRRTLMFYSWSRQALGAVISTALEHPSWVTIPSKFQYGVANEAGLNPDSVGKPTGTDPRIPSYEADSVYGPTFQAGNTPFDLGQPAADNTVHLWGLSMSVPQLDAMTSFFGGTSLDNKSGPVTGFLQGLAGSLNPLIKTPIEAGLDISLQGTIAKTRSQDPVGFWSNATGVGGTAVQILGLNPKKINTPNASQTPKQQALATAQGQAAQQRALLNWISGLKFTDYTNATAAKVAGTEKSVDDTAKLTAAGYSPAQIKTIRSIWKMHQKAAQYAANSAASNTAP